MHFFEHYCDELENVENYEKAKAEYPFTGWNCHHHLETHSEQQQNGE